MVSKVVLMILIVVNIGLLVVCFAAIGGVYTKVNQHDIKGVLAYGYYEPKNEWYRIQVDEHGKIACQK